MNIVLPDNTAIQNIEQILAVAPMTKISRLHIQRDVSIAQMLLPKRVRQRLPYWLYGHLQTIIDRSERIALSINGVPLDVSRAREDVLLATGVIDERVGQRLVAALPNLRWVHSTTGGVDRFDIRRLRERNILLTSSTGLHSGRIAEFVMGMIYADAKNIVAHWNNTRRRVPTRLASRELTELTVGIVGLGSIGQSVAHLAQSNGMQVIGYIRPERKESKVGETHVTPDLKKVLETSDVLVLALPLTQETRGMIGAKQLGCMKSTSILINVGRGATVVEKDLVTALREGLIRGAWLDVVDRKPIPKNHPLVRLGNVVCTGHSASLSNNTDRDLLMRFVENVKHYQLGEPLKGKIDLSVGY